MGTRVQDGCQLQCQAWFGYVSIFSGIREPRTNNVLLNIFLQHRQCTKSENVVPTMSMCCGLGGPGALNAQKTSAAKAGGISAGVIIPIIAIAVVFGLYMRRKAKPVWWPKFLRRDMREETGHVSITVSCIDIFSKHYA